MIFGRAACCRGALAPELSVHCEADCDDATLNALLYEAVVASPLNGLARGKHPSPFNLVHNGQEIIPTQVTLPEADPLPELGDRFTNLAPLVDSPAVDNLISELSPEAEGYASLSRETKAPGKLAANQHLVYARDLPYPR